MFGAISLLLNIEVLCFYTHAKNLEKLNLVLCWTGCPPTMTIHGSPLVSVSLIDSQPDLELWQVITPLKGGPQVVDQNCSVQ